VDARGRRSRIVSPVSTRLHSTQEHPRASPDSHLRKLRHHAAARKHPSALHVPGQQAVAARCRAAGGHEQHAHGAHHGTVWRAWIGFNASHSLCAIFFGLVFGYLALGESGLLFRSLFLQLLGLGVLVAFVVLARLYWFSIPLFGVSLALGCHVAGLVVARM
jgi:hypothetical protein